MKLRKINAVFSLISTILIMGHAISIGISMLSRGATQGMPSAVSRVMTGAVAIHAILCFASMAAAHKGAPKATGKAKEYPRFNAPTLIQRMGGVLIIPFSALHILGAVGITQPPQVVHAILPPVFFTFVLMHVAISASKAFITLGIGNVRFVKRLDIAIKVLCAATLIADLVGFYLFVC